jgi:hypothetical protein
MENMHHYITKIRNDPLAGGHAVDGLRADAVILAEAVAEFPDDGLQVRLAGAGADHEKIGEARQAAQVERDDVFGFLIRGDGRAELG